MIYIYDILLNWTDDNKVYEFFEWEENDMIEHIKKMPLLKTEEKVLSDFLMSDVKVEDKFLKTIKNKSEIFCQKKTEIIEYACLFTDGKRVLAVEFDDSGRNIYRSYLLLDEEFEILDIGERLNIEQVSYQIISTNDNNYYFTREEEIMKKYILKELKMTYQSKNYNKLQYLYSECFNDNLLDMEEIYQKFINSLEDKFTENHLRIYQLLKLSHTRKQV